MATAAITGNNDNDDDRIFVQVIEDFDIWDKDGCSNEFIVCCAGLGDGDEY